MHLFLQLRQPQAEPSAHFQKGEESRRKHNLKYNERDAEITLIKIMKAYNSNFSFKEVNTPVHKLH